MSSFEAEIAGCIARWTKSALMIFLPQERTLSQQCFLREVHSVLR